MMKTTKKRQIWAEQRQAVIEGKPLTPPKQAEIKYRAAMQRLVERMVADYARTLLAEIKDPRYAMNANIGSGLGSAFSKLGTKWVMAFRRVSRKLTKDMIARVDHNSRTTLNDSLKQLSGGLTIKTPKMPKGMEEIIAAATTANVSLIKTIPTQFHDKIEARIMASVQQGAGSRDIFQTLTTELKSELVELGGRTKRRAELIARDQSHKIAASINAERAKSVGLTKFKWRHSGASFQARELHKSYDGKIFSYDDLPIIEYRNGTPIRGLPAEAINCRCVAIPVIDFADSSD